MTKDTKSRIGLIYSICLSAVIVFAGICLIAACIGIYRSGDDPFSRASVAAAFSEIASPIYLCLAMVIVGFILELLIPGSIKKNAAPKQYDMILRHLHKKADLSQCSEALSLAILAEQKKRKTHRWITVALLILGSVVFLIYALDGRHFHQTDINGSMRNAIWVLLPCMAVPFGYAVCAAYHAKKSMQREIALLKQIARSPLPPPAESEKSGKAPAFLRYSLLILALAVLVYGFYTGGTVDVLTKAINICTECVGLG